MNRTLFEDLRAFLNHPSDYNAGVALLYAINHSDAIHKSLLSKPNKVKLMFYLEAVYEKAKSNIENETTPSITANKVESIKENVKSTELTDIEATQIRLFKELAYYHAQMCEAKDDEERFELVKKCVELDAMLGQNHKDIQFFHKHGRLPERNVIPKIKDCTDSMLMVRTKLSTMPQTIRNDRRLIETLTKQLESKDLPIAELRKINEKLKKAKHRLSEKLQEKKKLELQIKELTI